MLFKHVPVIVRGGGDLASGVIYRLIKAGFPVLVTELARPLVIRRTVAFATAVFDGQITIEGLTARRIEAPGEVPAAWARGEIPVLVGEDGACFAEIRPAVVIDARIAKRVLDTRRDDAPLVVALGPGFEAGRDCHAVIETNRGHSLGRVIWLGSAEPDTGTPGEVKGFAQTRILRAPVAGFVTPCAAIGDSLVADEPVAEVGGEVVRAPFAGVLRGLLHSSVPVQPGLKIGDVDPRGVRNHCFTISEKALAIGGGVLEAVLSAPQLFERLRSG